MTSDSPRKLLCPRDGTLLQAVSVLDVELDKCPGCEGLWCDHGELERLRDAPLSDLEKSVEQQEGNPQVEVGEVKGYMRCPRCEGRLQRVRYTYMQPVAIDRCESCLGVWLDSGELDRIAGEKRRIDREAEPNRLKLFLRSMLGK